MKYGVDILSTSECHAYAMLNIFQTVSTAYVNHLTTGLKCHLTAGFKNLFTSAMSGNKSDFHLTFSLSFMLLQTSNKF